MESGIYQIKNIVTGRVYIGSSNNIHKRWGSHKHNLKNNKHKNGHLQSSYNKHGPENFEFTIVEYCEPSLFVVQEQRFIDENFPLVYNQRKVAESNLGMKHSAEAREKIRTAGLGRNHTEETKEKCRAGNLGKTHSEETKEKCRGAKQVYSKEKILELYALLKLHKLKKVGEVTGINASTLSNIKHGLRYKQYYHLYNS